MTARLAVLASGAGSNLQAVIDACAAGRIDARVEVAVVNRAAAGARDLAAAAGVDTWYRPMASYRDRFDDARLARRAYDADLAAELIERVQPDWVVLAGWLHIFTSAFTAAFEGRIVNLHPSLPATFPGATAIDDAWRAHETSGLAVTGVMVHLVPDEGVDDGPVLASVEVPIGADDTRDSLEERIHQVEHELLVATLADLCRDEV